MTTREKLYRLIDELPEGDLPTAERALEALRDTAEAVREWHIDDRAIQ